MEGNIEAVPKRLNLLLLTLTLMQVSENIYIDTDLDLSSLFNWNTKQVFAFLVAEYSTPKYVSTTPFSDANDRLQIK